jgi:two-component system NtrC family sensor kinase
MLQHSRSSAGQKESADINALVEEYLRLSYHGFRAKENTFSALIQSDFNRQLENIHIVAPEIGRVLLNLFNNSFYAMNEKRKLLHDGYQPNFSIQTKKQGNKIEIRLKDNGIGIPKKILDKIFQPFYTTKPTGQGTGLGLSLSYDIIKAHCGEIRVNSIEGEFAEFVILLPA